MAHDPGAAILSALTTEHFVLQGALANAVSEANSRASMYLAVLSGALVAMGFVTQSDLALMPFVATVLPAIFLMGLLTVLRLIDISIESSMAYVMIARIRGYYRELGGDAPAVFDARVGRWPEQAPNPSLRLGAFFGYWTSAAAMIAAINAFIGGATLALLLCLGLGASLVPAIAAGALLAAGLLVLFHLLQRMRIAETDRFAREVAGVTPSYSGTVPDKGTGAR